MAKRSGKSFWIALASFTLIMLILAGYVEELVILDQPLVTLIEQIMSEEIGTPGETYEGGDINIPGGYGESGSTGTGWGKTLVAEDTIQSGSSKTISVDDHLKIVFPYNSVKEASRIVVYRLDNPTPIAGDWQPIVAYDIDLSAKLEANVTLEFQLDLTGIPEGVNLDELISFAEYIEEYNMWVLIPSKIKDGKLVASVSHFSVKGILVNAAKAAKSGAISVISSVFKGVESRFEDVWAKAKDWVNSTCTETAHFKICYPNTTLFNTNVPADRAAVNLGQALELARDRYMKAGFKVPSKKTVYIMKGEEKNQYSMIFGNIYVQDTPTEGELHASAFHELFHAVQDQYLALIYHMTVARTHWFIEATADYAAYRIAAGKGVESEITLEYFEKPFTYTDGVHEYSTAHLLDYAIRRTDFLNLWLNACKSSSSKASYANVFMTYASQLNGKSFTDVYYGFAKYMIFNDTSRLYKSGYLQDSVIPVVGTLSLNGNLTREVTLESFTAKLILVKIEYDSSKDSNRTLSISMSGTTDGEIRVGVFTAPTKQGSLSNERVQLPTYREKGVLSGKNELKVKVNKGERLILLAVAAPSEYKEKSYKIKITVMDAINTYQFGYSYSEKIDSTPPTEFKLKVSGSIQGLPENAVAVFQSEGVKEGNIYSGPPVVNVSIKDFKNPITLKITLYVETNLKKGTMISFKSSRPEIDYVKECTMEFSDPEYLICTGRYESSCTIKLNAVGSPATLTYDYRLNPPLDSDKTLIFTLRWSLQQKCKEVQYGKEESWEEKGTEYIAILIVYLHRGS